MKQKPNAKIIGIFICLSTAVVIGLVLFFGSSTFFQQSSRFVLFFDQSVNGLAVGSPVKFRGVPVGAVESIMIHIDGQDKDSRAIPVIIRINQSRLVRDFGVAESIFDADAIATSIERGLVGGLSLESFITGQLFVELSFEPDRSEGYTHYLSKGDQPHDFIEIPTKASALDQITSDVAELVSDIRQIDLDFMVENLNRVLVNLGDVLEGIDSAGMSVAVMKAAEDVSELVASEELQRLLVSVEQAVNAIKETAQSYDAREGPLAERLEQWTQRLEGSLDGLDALMLEAEGILKPGSSVRGELETSLREFGRAARAVRFFADFLERNPNALLTGRAEGEE